jgi:hypothetical protein
MKVSPFEGKPAEASMLANVPRLVTAYYSESPDPSVPGQRFAFGTSGHRGSPFEKAFNEWHILAISHAICLYREQNKIDGPLFRGSSFGDREHLQDLCGELPGSESSASHPGKSTDDRRRCSGGLPAAARDSVRAPTEGAAMRRY